MLDVNIKETTATTGTGTLTLSAASGFVRVSDAFTADELVSYALESGNGDKEWGIGTPAAGNTFVRGFVQASLVGGTFNNTNPTAISLTGTSTLICTQNTATWQGSSFIVPVAGITQYLCPYITTTSTPGSLSVPADTIHAIPFTLAVVPPVLTELGITVTTGGAGDAYLGIYETALVSGKYAPGKLLGQTAAISVSTTGDKTGSGLSIPLKAGRLYWLAMCLTAAVSMRVTGSASGALGFTPANVDGYRSHLRANNTGALPSDASALSYSVANKSVQSPIIYMVY